MASKKLDWGRASLVLKERIERHEKEHKEHEATLKKMFGRQVKERQALHSRQQDERRQMHAEHLKRPPIYK